MESTGPPHDERLQPLLEEFMDRNRRGERPSITEYEEAHPELADPIREVFSAMLMMEDLNTKVAALAELISVVIFGSSC